MSADRPQPAAAKQQKFYSFCATARRFKDIALLRLASGYHTRAGSLLETDIRRPVGVQRDARQTEKTVASRQSNPLPHVASTDRPTSSKCTHCAICAVQTTV